MGPIWFVVVFVALTTDAVFGKVILWGSKLPPGWSQIPFKHEGKRQVVDPGNRGQLGLDEDRRSSSHLSVGVGRRSAWPSIDEPWNEHRWFKTKRDSKKREVFRPPGEERRSAWPSVDEPWNGHRWFKTKRDDLRTRGDGGYIVGGSDAKLGEFPFYVRIDMDGHYCGASLISDQWVLSAAHCFYGVSKKKFSFILGQHKLYELYGHEVGFTAERIIMHPKYDNDALSNDIALVKLDKKVTFNKFMKPITLPAKNEVFAAGSTCTVIGFGVTKEDGNNPEILQKVDVPIVSTKTCQNAMGNAINSLENICAGFKSGGKDSCQEDSGGPFICKSSSGAYKLAGAVSWGIGCAEPGKYGIYTNVASYIDWIKSVQKLYS